MTTFLLSPTAFLSPTTQSTSPCPAAFAQTPPPCCCWCGACRPVPPDPSVRQDPLLERTPELQNSLQFIAESCLPPQATCPELTGHLPSQRHRTAFTCAVRTPAPAFLTKACARAHVCVGAGAPGYPLLPCAWLTFLCCLSCRGHRHRQPPQPLPPRLLVLRRCLRT